MVNFDIGVGKIEMIKAGYYFSCYGILCDDRDPRARLRQEGKSRVQCFTYVYNSLRIISCSISK